MPDLSRKSALPDLLVIALLPCLNTFPPAWAITKLDKVEQLKIFKFEPPVPHVSIKSPDIFSRFSNLFINTFDNELRKNSFMPFSLIFLRIFSCSSMVISSLNRCSK